MWVGNTILIIIYCCDNFFQKRQYLMKLSRSLSPATESPISKAWVPLSNARFAHTHYLLETLYHKWRVSFFFFLHYII